MYHFTAIRLICQYVHVHFCYSFSILQDTFFDFLRFFETGNALFIGFCGRGTNPRRVSAAKACTGTAETRLCTWGRDPNGGRTPTAAGPPAATITASDDARQHRQQPSQAAQAERRTHPSPGTMHSRRTRPGWTADRPPRTTGTQAPPAPATIDSSTEDTTPSPTPPRTPTGPATRRLLLYTPITADSPPQRQTAHYAVQLDSQQAGYRINLYVDIDYINKSMYV